MSKESAIVAIVFAFICGLAVGHVTTNIISKGEKAASEAEDRAVEAAAIEETGIERYRVPVTEMQPAKGPSDALVTIVQVSDYQCPFCSRVEPTIDQLMKDYKGKLRVVWRNNPLPFHNNAMPAAEATSEAKAQGGDEKFWKMHELLFKNQQNLGREDLEKYAQEVGLNVAKFKKALDDHTHKGQIEADVALANRLGARGTPAFFINGRYLSGAQPVEQFKTIIDDELKRADKLVKAGVSKAGIYLALTKKGLTEAKTKEAQAQAPRRRPDPDAVYKVPVAGSPQKGSSDALVTIIEFADYQCPFCSRVIPTMEKIQSTYGKDVRYIFKQNPLPFHQNAMPASQAALAAGAQGKFWQMHEKLFQNQQALTRPDLEKYAKEIGLNLAKFKKALDENAGKDEIEEDQKLARSIGASGTPSFFINGRNLRGAQPFEAFKAVIDAELAKAKERVAKGTPRAKLYETIIANGATSPQFINLPGGDAPSPAPDRPAEPSADQVYEIPVPPGAPRKGARNGKVVIQQFSDFQCPFCSRVEPTVEQIIKQYGDKVTVVWRNFPLPFHPFAKPAAEATVEVYAQGGAEKFWKFHGLLFANQQALSRADLEKYAEQVGGINMARFKKALDDGAHAKAVEADIEAVNKAGARIGTPSFFINGKLLQGAQPFEAFKQAIDRALAGK